MRFQKAFLYNNSKPTNLCAPMNLSSYVKFVKKRGRLDLGNDPVGPLLLRMSLPSMAAMLATSLYNIVDTFWIAKISPDAIAALTICFPIQMIFSAIGFGTGLGAGSFASRMFGKGDKIKAHRTAGQIIFLSIFFGLSTIFLGTIFYDSILTFFGATRAILPLSEKYLTIVVFGAPFLFFMMMSDNLFRAEGNPTVPMLVIMTSAILNVVLDPFLIFGWGPFPEMGIQGAALATVMSQFISILLSSYFLFSTHSRYKLKWRYLLPEWSIIKAIYQVGFPSFIVNVAMSLVLTVYNQKLAAFGTLAVATLGLGFRINGILMMLIFGIGHGVMPIVGFSAGARNYKRLKDVVRFAVKFSACIAGVTCVLIEIFVHPILTAFTKDPGLLAIAAPALKIYISTQILVGPVIVWIHMFNGLGKGITSMILMLTRQLLFLIPLIFILPHFFDLNGVWMAQPIANVLVFFIVRSRAKRELRNLKLET